MNGVYASGPHMLSRREARVAHALILQLHPHLTRWFTSICTWSGPPAATGGSRWCPRVSAGAVSPDAAAGRQRDLLAEQHPARRDGPSPPNCRQDSRPRRRSAAACAPCSLRPAPPAEPAPCARRCWRDWVSRGLGRCDAEGRGFESHHPLASLERSGRHRSVSAAIARTDTPYPKRRRRSRRASVASPSAAGMPSTSGSMPPEFNVVLDATLTRIAGPVVGG